MSGVEAKKYVLSSESKHEASNLSITMDRYDQNLAGAVLIPRCREKKVGTHVCAKDFVSKRYCEQVWAWPSRLGFTHPVADMQVAANAEIHGGFHEPPLQQNAIQEKRAATCFKGIDRLFGGSICV